MRWTAIWSPGPGRLRWQLTVTDEAGNVAMVERSKALYGSPRPSDDLLVTMGLAPKGDWEAGEGGSFSCPVLASEEREGRLIEDLLVRGRSGPGARAGPGESSLMPRDSKATGG